MADIVVEVGTSLDTWVRCTYYKGPAFNVEDVKLQCSSLLTGRYVKLSGGSDDSNCHDGEFLVVCEVEVYGSFI